MRLLALALGALVLAAAPADGWRTFRTDGVSVRYPSAWFATSRALTDVTSPRRVLALSSYPIPRGPGDGCAPREALDAMPPGGALLFGWTYGDVSPETARDFPPRPRHFRLTTCAHFECSGPSYVVRFRAAGRAFQIHVAFGPRATRATRATALRILDSFHATRR
jgi:hypothetical protein